MRKSPAELSDDQIKGKVKSLRKRIGYLNDGVDYLNQSLSFTHGLDNRTRERWKTLRHADHMMRQQLEQELNALLREQASRVKSTTTKRSFGPPPAPGTGTKFVSRATTTDQLILSSLSDTEMQLAQLRSQIDELDRRLNIRDTQS